MSKPKTQLKQSKGKKRKEPILSTADDFLAAGVDHEEAAGKWRAGDAAKSLRFFSRAVEVYDQGLQMFPRSLDLAYNKARVQLEIVTHPVLVRQLQVPLLQGLEEALLSHRYALSLGPDDANTLFNTAQVLTTTAEELGRKNDGDVGNVLKLLEEALELQGRCLSIQEMKFDESERQRQAVQEQPDDASSAPQDEDMASNTTDAEDQWFSVIEPVTLDTLIDTGLAQLGTLTTLCSILGSAASPPPSPSLPWIDNFSSALLNQKLSMYARDSDASRLQEIGLSKANFLSAFLEASFHQGTINADTYRSERENAFKVPELLLDQYPDGLIANAQSLISFSSALADQATLQESYHSTIRWQSLSAAISTLVMASKLQKIDSETLVKTHLLRGEASFLLWQLSQPPASLATAVSNRIQLLKNAEVFYRNASKLSTDDEDKAVAAFRSSIASALQQSGSDLRALLSKIAGEKGDEWVKGQIADMVGEDLLPETMF